MKWLLATILCFFLALPARAQGPIYLPVIIEDEPMSLPDPMLRVTDGTTIVDLLGPGSGWRLADPYWNPQIAQYKGGGTYVNSGMAEGQRLVGKQYDNVIEAIPLSLRGTDQAAAVRTVRELLQLGKQASDYWTRPYEYDDVWLEARPACSDCLAGYARIVKMSIPELTNPYGQPFFSASGEAVMEGISLVVEREPLWRGLPPGQIIGPLYNLLRNPDFELWNAGVADSQPDSWSDLETLQITGQNSREATAPNSGQYALKIRVGSSVAAGKAKGVFQTVEGTRSNTEYTVVAWVRSEGVSNGVGRILVTYSGQLEVYRSAIRHGWTLYTGTFTTGTNDVVAVNLEILTTAANTDGTIYVDSLMLLEGDWVEAAENNTLPYMTSSHIVNHWDQPGGAVVEAGDINFVDVWNVPGDEDALIRLEVQNNTTPADETNIVEKFSTLRIGQRRTGNIFDFDNYHDPAGDADATASSDDRVTVAPNNSWNDVSTHSIIGGDVARANEGRYRVFARVYDAKASGEPTLEARLRYWLGVSGVNIKTLNAMAIRTRAQWTIADLTSNAAMIWDTKFQSGLPSAWGATIQFRRSSGTGNAYLDYLMAIPTDGGYLQATVDPAYGQGAALTIDNTASQMISVSGVLTGYVNRFTIADDPGSPYLYARGVGEFKGDLYLGARKNTGPAEIWRLRGGTWSLVYSNSSYDGAYSLTVYNGRLYAAIDQGGGAAVNASVISTEDGVSWRTDFTSNNFWIFDMVAFDGYLFLAGGQNNPRYIMRWDGSTLVNETSLTGVNWQALAVYGNKLYAGTGQNTAGGPGDVYVRSSAGVWSLSLASGQADVWQMVEFNGKLYVATGDEGEIYAFDGSAWSKVYDAGASSNRIQTIAKLDNVLYAGISLTGTSTIVASSDGITWNTIYDPESVHLLSRIVGFEGIIYIYSKGTDVLVIDSIVPDKEVQYSIADFQGSSFTAPPRRYNDPRRHRWVFSFDRENYVNNADDRALIGLGYVPRYLTLRGAD